MTFPTLRIRGGSDGFSTSVELDGKRIPVTRIELTCEVGSYNKATIELYVAPDVDLLADVAEKPLDVDVVPPKKARRADPS